jgi:hypothetical protein
MSQSERSVAQGNDRTQKPVRAITFAAPTNVFFWRLFMESGKSCRRVSTNQREVTILTWVLGLNPSVK